jgi:uncharacterized protein YxeA
MKKNFIIFLALIVLVFAALRFSRNNNLDSSSKAGDAFRDTNHLILTKHVKCRMDCRHINIEEIKKIINEGEVNNAKSGKGSRGDETYALEGYSNDREHLRVVVAPESDGLVVITCIDLDKEWPCNCD